MIAISPEQIQTTFDEFEIQFSRKKKLEKHIFILNVNLLSVGKVLP